MTYFPPPAFRFKVQIAGSPLEGDAAFTDVSGLDAEIEIEEIKEGGENGYSHRLPGRVKYGNLVLKRGIMLHNSLFSLWCQGMLESAAGGYTVCHDLNVFLLDEGGDPVLTWHCNGAYPVKWSVGALNASQNEVAVETLEFVYQQLRRS